MIKIDPHPENAGTTVSNWYVVYNLVLPVDSYNDDGFQRQYPIATACAVEFHTKTAAEDFAKELDAFYGNCITVFVCPKYKSHTEKSSEAYTTTK